MYITVCRVVIRISSQNHVRFKVVTVGIQQIRHNSTPFSTMGNFHDENRVSVIVDDVNVEHFISRMLAMTFREK